MIQIYKFANETLFQLIYPPPPPTRIQIRHAGGVFPFLHYKTTIPFYHYKSNFIDCIHLVFMKIYPNAISSQ